MAKIKVMQNRNGKRITFLTEDKGKPGKTPESGQWYNPKIHTDWEKDMPGKQRRRKVLKAHDGNELASARAMQALANVTTDKETRMKARKDAQHFFSRHQRTPRITPKMPRLR